jgi:Lon protease-like protein
MSEINKTPRTLEHCRKISDDALGLEYVANELQYWAEKLEKENTALREQLKDCSAVVDRQQEQLDRNAERLADAQAEIERLQKIGVFDRTSYSDTLLELAAERRETEKAQSQAPRDTARVDTLEEAAKVCDEYAKSGVTGAMVCAAAIRAMKVD